MIGEVLGGYRVTAKIGEGGMGVVYRAEHTIMGRKAVVKVLRAQLSSNREMVQRFFNEARAAAAISHPGIVSVFDLGQREDGCAYIVMDFLNGESLGSRLRRQGRLPSHEALAITRQILSALSAAHSRGIVHRDLKPDNIFLVPDAELPGGERIKLLDFGIAKLQDDSGPGVLTTRAGALMGTPAYMSPEQCRGAGSCDHRADLYSVGVMLFELLTGRPPFVAKAAGDLIAAHMRDAPPRLGDRVSGLPEGLESIVAVLLAKAPEDRYESGSAAIQQIDTLSGAFPAGTLNRSRSPSGHTREPTDALAQTMMEGSGAGQPQGTTLSESANSLEVVKSLPPKGSRRAWLGAALGLAVLGAVATAVALNSATEKTDPSEPSVVVQPGVADDAGGTEVVVAPTPDAAAAVLVAHETPLADALPRLVFDIVPKADNTKAKRLSSRGQRKLRDGDVEGAKADFIEALARDPGHLFGRYFYGGVLVTEGKVHEAVAILRQLKEAGCPQCLGRLQYAREDDSWESAWEDPAFIELTQSVRVRKPSVAKSGKMLTSALVDDDYGAAASLFAPREVITVWETPEGCGRNKCRTISKLQGREAIRSHVQEMGIKYGTKVQVGEQARCDRKCCRYALTPGTALQLREVCTTLDTAAVRSLSKLDFVYQDPSAPLE